MADEEGLRAENIPDAGGRRQQEQGPAGGLVLQLSWVRGWEVGGGEGQLGLGGRGSSLSGHRSVEGPGHRAGFPDGALQSSP